MIVADSLAVDLISLVVALLATFFVYCKWSFQYWKRKKVPYLEPRIPFGNLTESLLGKENFGVSIRKIYEKMKEKGFKHGGVYVFTSPSYIPIDLEYTKNIMSRDFQYFTDRNFYYNEKKDPLDAHLVNLGGPRWRNLRVKMTPTFTSGKMKMMFQTVADCQDGLLKKMEQQSKKKPIDIKEILARFTTEIIGSCAFGLDCKSIEDENSPFRIYGKKFFSLSKMKKMIRLFCMNFPAIASYLDISMTSTDITHFFINVIKDTVDYREKNNFVRNDFLQLLIDVKNNENVTIEEVAAQCFLFFVAGFETSSTAMTFALYELSKNQEIQEKVRNEIGTILAKYGGKVTYEGIKEMKYLDQVIDEALRMYPPFPFINRRCVKDYKIPNEDVVIEKGTTVIIPFLGIHYDKEYYPDPEKFDPERFTEEKKNSRNKFEYLPFGEGPRICLGIRFAVIQAKVGLSCLIKNYKFTVNKKTIQPLKMHPTSPILSALGEIWLDVQKL